MFVEIFPQHSDPTLSSITLFSVALGQMLKGWEDEKKYFTPHRE